ncbi:hypothetical protein [Paraperlucidibaca sp.]|uniref:type II secretion system protein GspD n=1 Tax=Paraperlucidibaca sp. TaxID=2708021 RepID=UPI0030F3A57E
MNKLLFAVLALLISLNSYASTKLDLKGITVANAVQLIYSESLKNSFVIAPEVLADGRTVSFRHEASQGKLKPFLLSFLDSLGYTVEERSGIDFISKKKAVEGLSSSDEEFLYLPKYRDVSYMARLLQPVFSGRFAVNRSVRSETNASNNSKAPDGSAASLIDQDADALLFSGSRLEIVKLKRLLGVIDRPVGEVTVQGMVYEVSTTKKDGSALKLAAEILNGKLTVGLGTALTTSEALININGASFDAVITALNGDSRFNSVSSPSLRIKSGATGHFSVGQEVPVLGAISYAQGSSLPIQSIEYRSSGVIFDVEPDVREQVVDLKISQQLSNFVRTETGVNGSPTLMKRSVETVVSMSDGDVILLGGLAEMKDSSSSTSVPFFSWFGSKQSEKSKTEILLIMQLRKM